MSARSPITDICLGRQSEALALLDRATRVITIEKDAIDGPIPIEFLARVAARMGDGDRAVPALEQLLSIPYDGALALGVPLTQALLNLDPMFDPIRDDPRFRKLAVAIAPNSVKH